MGIDMATRGQLIAAQLEVEDICKRIGADSLAYLSLEGMHEAVRLSIQQKTGHCNACFSGQYPIPIPDWLFEDERPKDKLIFERALG
jgi:amidophosphoribosyltransferase